MSRVTLNVTRLSVEGPTLAAVNAVTILFWSVVKTGTLVLLCSVHFGYLPTLLTRV